MFVFFLALSTTGKYSVLGFELCFVLRVWKPIRQLDPNYFFFPKAQAAVISPQFWTKKHIQHLLLVFSSQQAMIKPDVGNSKVLWKSVFSTREASGDRGRTLQSMTPGYQTRQHRTQHLEIHKMSRFRVTVGSFDCGKNFSCCRVDVWSYNSVTYWFKYVFFPLQ